ncbi:MAG: hypothetical protein K2M95_06285 [Clostridiales bacterium]|nr:hypothetical protein [Clostridiales bacterium]
MEIALRIITGGILSFFVPLLINVIIRSKMPKWEKWEMENEQEAKSKNYVKLDKNFYMFFLVACIIVNLTGILIVALPKLITKYIGFSYIVILIIWWAMLIFDDTMLCLMCTQATYDDEKIVVKKVFCKPKEYYYSDIVDYTVKGNLKVKTTKGNFLLFNLCAGTSSLRDLIIRKCNNPMRHSNTDK